MKILCNGEPREVETGTTVSVFLDRLELAPETVVVEYNGRILPKEEYDRQGLEEGGVLELIRFVGGG